MSEEITFAPIHQHQVHLLQKVSKETFLAAFASWNKPENLEIYFSKAFSTQTLIKQLNNPSSSFSFIYSSGEIAGYFKINTYESQTEIKAEDGLEVERLYLYPKFQNKGLGKKVLDEIKILGLQENKKYIWLGVWEHNLKAIRFYHANGFAKFDQHVYPMGDDPQIDWMMKFEL